MTGRPELASWFLDLEDLGRARVGAPPWRTEAQRIEAARRFSETGYAARLEAMARHMAFHAHFDEDRASAAAFVALADDVAHDFAGSVLLADVAGLSGVRLHLAR